MKQQNERAVSPVVGVMLMLVVVIIIAAVVSGFAGGLVGGKNQKTPQLAMDAQIVNTGYWSSSYLKAEVTGVDDPIRTQDLKIVTSWSKTLQNGSTITGGATVTPGVDNFNVIYDTHGGGSYDLWQTVVPQGYGPGVGVNGTEFPNFWPVEGPSGLENQLNIPSSGMTNFTWFGNYRLQAGTIMFARPFGGKLGGQSAGTGSFGVGYGIAPNVTAGTVNGGRYQYAYGIDWTGTTSCVIHVNPSCGGAVFELPKSYVGQTNPDGTQVDPNNPMTYSTDQMQSILGDNWNILRSGDVVTMKVIHTPSGKTIWQKDISVEGT
jgi:FlaG/FlaF family flagellin (archaellin)